MKREEQVFHQRAFYATRPHEHLRPRRDDYYAQKLVHELATTLGIASHHRVVEIGAGFGRFTFPLLDRCRTVIAVDLSPRVLADLAGTRDERGIAAARCPTVCADADVLALDALDGPVDFIVGFFLLHHLADCARTLRALARLLRPGGGLGFVEPNRRNPLFLAQVLVCPDMTWREERGMFRLRERAVEGALRAAGLHPRATRTLGFFPPPLLNRSVLAQRLEARLDRARTLRWIRPFLLLTAQAPA